jgi:TolB-like protein/DNA-binding winged helix-turn-helix (wHTH) protein/Tfp pilus assembly protein PilF
MHEFPAAARILRFGVFELDLHSAELKKRGIRVKLQGQPFLLLVTLLKKRGDLVTRDELRSTLWPDGTFIDFDHSLGTALNKVREVLGDSATTPRFVETLPKRGYRFIAPVEIVDSEVPSPKFDPSRQLPAETSSSSRLSDVSNLPVAPAPWKLQMKWWISGLLVLASVATFATWKSRLSPPFPVIRSLAVLPLENLSGDPSQDYFSDGMTDELITELGQLSELRVISRTSVMTYKTVRKPLPQVARELNVDAVVEGTVLRSGSQVRITAQLIEAASDRHIWAQSYVDEVRNTLDLQRKVARAIAGQIRIKVNSREEAALRKVRSIDPEAHEAYLKGRFFWNRRTGEDLKRAVEYFNQAIANDPNYAEAYSGMADSYALMGDWEYGVMTPKEALPKARAAATKALALDNTLADAHTSLAFCLNLFDWDWDGAESQYKKAIQLNPNYATAHQWYAWHLIETGRNDEAVDEMRTAGRLDPLSLIISADTADILLVTHRFDDSIKQSRMTMELDPHFAVGRYQLGQALAQKHAFPEAIDELQKAIDFSSGSKAFVAHLAYVYAVSGEKRKAMELLKGLINAEQEFANAAEISLIYVGLGDRDQAMQWLDRAYAERFNPTILFRPSYDPIRSDPRFHQLLHRIGLE